MANIWAISNEYAVQFPTVCLSSLYVLKCKRILKILNIVIIY